MPTRTNSSKTQQQPTTAQPYIVHSNNWTPTPIASNPPSAIITNKQTNKQEDQQKQLQYSTMTLRLSTSTSTTASGIDGYMQRLSDDTSISLSQKNDCVSLNFFFCF
jgi:hypothetical protein